MSTPKRKPNVAKVMVMARKCFDIELTPPEAQKIVNLLVEKGIEIILFLAKKPPRSLIAFVEWMFPRIEWGLNRLNRSDTYYDDCKRGSRWEHYQSEGRDPMIHYRDEKGRIDWKKLDKEVTPLGEILKKYKKRDPPDTQIFKKE